MKCQFLLILGSVFVGKAFSQETAFSLVNKVTTLSAATYSKEEKLKKEFLDRNLSWPARDVYIRSFKYDSQLEVWLRNAPTESYTLFKTYSICTLSGTLGPKRYENDYQVPEGFYHITDYRPKSEFHMALGISYPNASDGLLSDSIRPGGGIYIHGSCVTTGCIPIRDEPIEEVYLLASLAKQQGQDFIPVHIFPIRFHTPRSEQYMAKNSRDNFEYQRFSTKLRHVYDYFELHKKLPLIGVNAQGEYVFF
ncbi:MAG: murein L,D-transpeptidase family protein [Sediminibacterium sp.]